MSDYRVSSPERKPVFLLSDSRPLFGGSAGTLLPALQQSLEVRERNVTRAAYIGASNGDAREYFELFVAAMDGINLHETRMIRAAFGDDDRAFLERADLVLLAGGDIDQGWEILEATGMDAIITRLYFSGAVLVGVSAGAVQLGLGWQRGDESGVTRGLQIVPYYVDVHDEYDDWRELRALVAGREEFAKGFGISGAMICHADLSMEAVGQPVAEFERSVVENGRLKRNLLLPVHGGGVTEIPGITG